MLLKLRNIGKIYDSNDILTIGIRNVNLEFDYNEFVTIEGESGSGKSTLLNVIGANDTYEEGELYFNGVETSHYSNSDWEKYREKNIATVFQDFNIVENLTVMENVELALFRIDDAKERKNIAKNLLDRVGLTNQINQKGSKLSGGEKQRTVIARALAKDAPIILADEPTGNLDVKSSKEIAALLKEVSKDKLVIVVTHNPEFFKEYATRRVRIYDGNVSEDRVVTPAPSNEHITELQEKPISRKQQFKNTVWLGVLNYKSRPRFTSMMTFALFVCAITVFIILNLFSGSLIQPLTGTLDDTAVKGKLIVSAAGEQISEEALDELANKTSAGYSLTDRKLSQFSVDIPKSGDMLQGYKITYIYAPYEYALGAGEAVLVLPVSAARDENKIKEVFLGAGVGIENITSKKTLSQDGVYLYLSYDDLKNNGARIKGINSSLKIGEAETTVYAFEINSELSSGEINLVNSTYWNVLDKTAVLGVNPNKAYVITGDSAKNESYGGLVVQLCKADYDEVFRAQTTSAEQACLYFETDKEAREAVSKLPTGYLGMLSGGEIYVRNVGDVFTSNVLMYFALIAASLLFGVIISIVFMRSVKIYRTDFAVYRTLGISKKISSWSLSVQMLLVFLPTLVLLPVASLIATVIPGSAMAFISIGNYLFIEIMMLIVVELVVFGFNRSISGKSIRKSLKRGSK